MTKQKTKSAILFGASKAMKPVLIGMIVVILIATQVHPASAWTRYFAIWTANNGSSDIDVKGVQASMTPHIEATTDYDSSQRPNSRITEWVMVVNQDNGRWAQAGWYKGSPIAGDGDSDCPAQTSSMKLHQEYHNVGNYCYQLSSTASQGNARTYTVQNIELWGNNEWRWRADVDGLSVTDFILNTEYGRADAGLESIVDSGINAGNATFASLKYLPLSGSWTDWPYRSVSCTDVAKYITEKITEWTSVKARKGSAGSCQ